MSRGRTTTEGTYNVFISSCFEFKFVATRRKNYFLIAPLPGTELGSRWLETVSTGDGDKGTLDMFLVTFKTNY